MPIMKTFRPINLAMQSYEEPQISYIRILAKVGQPQQVAFLAYNK